MAFWPVSQASPSRPARSAEAGTVPPSQISTGHTRQRADRAPSSVKWRPWWVTRSPASSARTIVDHSSSRPTRLRSSMPNAWNCCARRPARTSRSAAPRRRRRACRSARPAGSDDRTGASTTTPTGISPVTLISRAIVGNGREGGGVGGVDHMVVAGEQARRARPRGRRRLPPSGCAPARPAVYAPSGRSMNAPGGIDASRLLEPLVRGRRGRKQEAQRRAKLHGRVSIGLPTACPR